MNESVLFWALVAFSYIGGAGTLAVIWLFRAPDPGRRVRGSEPAGQAPPAQPASRTVHHDYDTDAVYATGLADGFQARPFVRTNDSAGWVSGPMGGGGNGTWQPDDAAVPSGDDV